MPSHNPVLVDQLAHDSQQPQIKVCASCHSTLTDNTTSIFLPEVDAIVCTGCREHVLTARITQDTRVFRVDTAPNFIQTPSQGEGDTFQSARSIPESPLFSDEMVMTSVSQPGRLCQVSSTLPSTYSNKPSSLIIHCNTNNASSLPHHQDHMSSLQSTATTSRRQPHIPLSSNPLIDITRLRVRSPGYYCLHPGAIFQGTQKSGRNSYDVTVTIVDVDFSSSFLCGYLRIRGLTDDWPELTTYFDAEIIGSRYGFLTQNWGATEQEDLVHWGRFPAFRHLRPELKKPHLKMADKDRGAVFMRWKEKFLVPDHRVQDINGASFAGFYYICVDFNPPPPQLLDAQQTPTSENGDMNVSLPQVVLKPEVPRRARRDSSVRRTDGGLPSIHPGSSAPVATMSGFYYHQNSEPYQQLSLCHVPERTSSSFEFR